MHPHTYRSMLMTSAMATLSPENDAGAEPPPAAADDASILGGAKVEEAPAGGGDAKPEAKAEEKAVDKSGSAADALNADKEAPPEGDKPKAEEGKPGDDGKPAKDKAEGEKDESGEAEQPKDNSGDRLNVAELKAPEGFEALDADAVAKAEPVLRELGLDTAQAQKVMDLAAVTLRPLVEQALGQEQERFGTLIAETRAGWAKEAKADKEIGGANFAQNTALAAKARDQFGTPELKKMFDETGIGNHPELVRFFTRVGKAISEDSFHASNTETPEKPKSDAEVFYGEEYQPKKAG